MLKLYGVTTNLQQKMAAMKLAAVGYGLDRMGLGIFRGLEKTVTAAQEYTHQLSLMNAAGMSQAEIANSIGAAWSTTHKVITSTAAENLKQLRELRSLFGDQHMSEAYAVLPTVMRTQAVIEALTGKRNERLGFEMGKVAELRQTGVMTLPFLQRNMNELSKTLMAMGGTLDVRDFLMTLKYAKTAGLSLSDRFVYDFLPTFMQEVKGGGGGMMSNTSTAGSAIMRLYTQIVQGLVKKSAQPVWEEMGLIRPQDIVHNYTGGFQVKPGAVAGAQLFAQDPLAWVEKFTPAIDKYALRHHLTRIQAITSMGLPQNAAYALTTMMLKDAQFRRDQKLIESTPSGYESYQRLLKTNPMLAQQALHSQWQNLLAIIGYQILPKLVPYMVSFANSLDSLAKWMQKHPNLTKGLVIGLGSLALALSVVGKVMMSVALVKFLGLGPALSKMFTSTVTVAGGALARLSALTVAAAAGYWAGHEIWKHGLEGTKAGNAIGSAIAHTLAAFGVKSAEEAVRATDAYSASQAARSPLPAMQERRAIEKPSVSYIVPRAPSTTVVHTQINLDGKKLAQATTRHVAKALGAPQTGTSFFDGRAALVPAGGVQDY